MAEKTKPYELVVLGGAGVGKTALITQLVLNKFVENYEPTIQDMYRKQFTIDGESCMGEVTDTAGRQIYAARRPDRIASGAGFVFVYSISSKSSFTLIHPQIKASPSYPGSSTSSSPMPIMIIGNKSDEVTAREVSTKEGNALAKELGCMFVEVSAKDNTKVKEVFLEMMRQLKIRRGNGRNLQQPTENLGRRILQWLKKKISWA